MAAARRVFHGFAVAVFHGVGAKAQVAGRGDQLQLVAGGKLVLHVDGQPGAIGIADGADHLLGAEVRGALFVGLVFLRHVPAQEAFGVAAVRQCFQFVHHVHVKGFAGERVVDGLAVHLGGAGHVVGALGAAFDFQGVHAHIDQFRHVLDGAQVLGVHDVGAVLVFIGGNESARAVGLFQQDFFRFEGFHSIGGRGDQVAGLVVAVLYRFVVPAAGVGAGTLVGVPVVHVTGQQAARSEEHTSEL